MSTQTTITINPPATSDGDHSRWPERGFRVENPKIYLSKLATKYAKECLQTQDGVSYVLNALPTGYRLFGKARNKDPEHIDRYLYGHPSGYAFRSQEEFYAHFKSLMQQGNANGCTCFGCAGGRKKAKVSHPSVIRGPAIAAARRTVASTATATVSAPPRPGTSTPHVGGLVGGEGPLPPIQLSTHTQTFSLLDGPAVDEEGTDDIYLALVKKLKRHNNIDQAIEERTSFDWRINRGHIDRIFGDAKPPRMFHPRLGEIVLFVRDLPKGSLIAFDEISKTCQVWDTASQTFTGLLHWEAGLVTQIPEEPVGLADLMVEQGKEHNVNYSGFRVEPISEVGSVEKPWSKRSAYVPLHQIRPFIFYRELLKGVKPPEYHPTIGHTLQVMCSICLVERYHFKGTWPTATIFNKAVYLGPELIMVGDTVRLLPIGDNDPAQVTDIMQITSIKTKLIHLDAEDNPDYDSLTNDDDMYSRTFDVCIHVAGIGLTRDPTRAWSGNRSRLPSQAVPEGLALYNDWFQLHDPARRWEVPFMQVAGRCFEAEALQKWFTNATSKSTSPSELAGITTGIRGLSKAREYSKGHDKRIDVAAGKTWFWADTRIEQLDLSEVNNIPVTDYASGVPMRDPGAWKRALQIREKGAGFKTKMTKDEEDEYAQAVGRVRGRPRKSAMMAGSAVGMGSTIEEDESEDDDGADEIPARAPSEQTAT